MHERMLDKSQEPTFKEMLDYCGNSGKLWIEIENFLKANYNLNAEIRFPYGKDYGWGKSYKHNKKHICDIHAEQNSFTVFFQIRSDGVDRISEKLSEHALSLWKNRYPCGNGGWIRYRITEKNQLSDIKLFLTSKVKPIIKKKK